MGFTDETVRFNLNDGDKNEISNTLTNVYRSLAEKGYNPINQIVGYVLSGDPAYVPRYNDARLYLPFITGSTAMTGLSCNPQIILLDRKSVV